MPITREEKLLNTLATGVASGVEPITREEQYLAYIAGETATKPDAPITRKEAFLDRVPQGGVGGGGVTIKNQDKTITENGTYKADSGYTGLGTVTVDVQASGGTGENKLAQILDRSVTELLASDFAGAAKIGEFAFRGCTKLVTATLPDIVTIIDTDAFYGCTYLQMIELPKSLSKIGDSAFCNCQKLASVTIPNSVTFLGNSAFERCYEITNIVIPNSVTTFGSSVFLNCTELKTAIIKSDKVGMSSFQSCTKLESVELENTTEIRSSAFKYDAALKKVQLKSTTPPTLNSSAFTNCTALAQIIVPVGCAEAYKAATNWSKYADIIVEEGATE